MGSDDNRPAKPDAADGLHVHVESIKEALKRAEATGKLTPEDVRAIYTRRLQQFLSDNTRIWTMGSILLPLAIAPVGLLAFMEDPSAAQRVSLAFASIFLVLVWNVFADHHRGFQQRSQAWLQAIEEERWKLKDPGPEKAEMRPRMLAGRGFNVRRMRWSLVAVIAIFWLVAGVLWR